MSNYVQLYMQMQGLCMHLDSHAYIHPCHVHTRSRKWVRFWTYRNNSSCTVSLTTEVSKSKYHLRCSLDWDVNIDFFVSWFPEGLKLCGRLFDIHFGAWSWCLFVTARRIKIYRGCGRGSPASSQLENFPHVNFASWERCSVVFTTRHPAVFIDSACSCKIQSQCCTGSRNSKVFQVKHRVKPSS